MPGQNLVWYGSTGQDSGSEGASQPDRTRWLGNTRASQTLHEIQSTITSNQVSSHHIVDTARIGDGVQAHQLKWIAMQTGPTAKAAARVESFDTATGVFKLDRPLIGSGLAASGDFYRIFDANNVWPDVTAAQAAAGEERFRSICMENEHGATINDLRIYFRVLNGGGGDFARLYPDTVSTLYLNRANGSDQVDILNQLGQRDPTAGGGDGADDFDDSGGWRNPFAYGTADVNVPSVANNAFVAVWLRRTIQAGLRFRNSIAVQIIAETSTTGSDPDPLSSSAIMVYNVAGATITATLVPDRYVTVGGGTRVVSTVFADGVPLVGRPVKWDLAAGDPGSLATDDDPIATYDTTDAAGQVAATITSPDSLALPDDVTPSITVGNGGEVGDPT